MAEETDPRRQVALLAALIASTQERSAAVQRAFRQAAAVDGAVATTLADQLHRRLETIGHAVAVIDERHLRHSIEDSANTTWAVGSTEVFLLQRDQQRWDAERYLTWITRTLIDLLLIPEE